MTSLREVGQGFLARWGYDLAFESGEGTMTFVLAMTKVSAAAGVHFSKDGTVTVVETLGCEERGFESEDPTVRDAALLGLVDGSRPEAEWGKWRLARRISDPSDPAWYAILWGMGLAGGLRLGEDARSSDRCAVACAIDASGGEEVRAALLPLLPDDESYLPYPVLGMSSVLVEGDATRRRDAMSRSPFFARTIADHPYLLTAIDEGLDVHSALGSPALWGIGCRALRPEPKWRADRMAALGRLPYPPLASLATTVAAVAAVQVAHVPTTEEEFRAFEVLVVALEEMPSFRADFYRGASGIRHDLTVLLSPAKGRWMSYLEKVLFEARPNRAPSNWRADLALSDPERHAVIAGHLSRLLRRCLDVGEAFAKEVLVPFMVVEYDVMASSTDTVNGWKSLGSSALFRGEGLLRIVRAWRLWSTGSTALGLAERLGPVTWPMPFKTASRGSLSVTTLRESGAFAGRDGADGEPLERHLFDAMAGRTLVMDVTSGGTVSSTAALGLSFVDDDVDVDLLWHVGSDGETPPEADMEAVSHAMRLVAGTYRGVDEAWIAWLRRLRVRGGDYAWLMADANYRFEDEGLRRAAFEWWRPCMPRDVEDHLSFAVQDRFAPDVTAAMRHLKAAGILLFPHWRKSIRSALK